MIVVDTSALMAILLDEPLAEQCSRVLETSTDFRISAGTVAEALIVSARRNRVDDMRLLLEGLGLVVEPVTSERARHVAGAYAEWGKGIHSAGLNFGDCFAYALAHELGCPLLFVGTDFGKTDMSSALA